MVKHFFGDNGLTSTSANAVANLAKEFVVSKKQLLDSFSFVSTETKAAGNSYTTRVESDRATYDNVINIVSEIQQAYRLIAWLREALKCKEESQETVVMKFEAFVKDVLGEEIPVRPVLRKKLTEDDIIATWEKEKYNSLFVHQTNASTIGELIHNNGGITAARKEFFKRKTEPVEVIGEGRDLTVIQYSSQYSDGDVDKLFFDLQKLQREEQAKYNKLRHEIDSTIENDSIEANTLYEKEYKEYIDKYQQLNNKYNVYVSQKMKELKNLKIVIPDSLKDIYDKVQMLGKD
jgi:hypothetical protein